MNIILTGSLGHISKPLATGLIRNGHNVTIVSSTEERKHDIEALGGNAAIGQLYDMAFLAKTFRNADIIYLMQPPGDYFDIKPDPRLSWTGLASGYAEAIRLSGVTRVIHLSSVGAHTDRGVGLLAAHNIVENILKDLPIDVAIKFMRPVGFYYNMFGFIPGIKSQGAIFQNYGGDVREPWVSPLDIAAVIAEEIEKPFQGRTVRYIASDEASPNEVAKILGEAIGLPDLKWMVLSDEQFLEGLQAAGVAPGIAKGLVEMNVGRLRDLYDDYNRHKPALGKVKLKEFAEDFALVYKNKYII